MNRCGKVSTALIIAAIAFAGMAAYKHLMPETYSIHYVNYRGRTDIDKGFEKYLKDNDVRYRIHYYDLARDPKNLKAIKGAIVKDKDRDLVVSWGTTVSLGIFGSIDKVGDSFIHSTPGVFTLVSNPLGSRLVHSLESPGRNITGSWHVSPIDNQLRAMMVYKEGNKRVGVLYTPTENNSVVILGDLQESAVKLGVEIFTIPFDLVDGKPVASNTAAAIAELKSKNVDWLYLLPDSHLGTVAKDLVIPEAHRNGLVTFASTEQLMLSGAAFGLIVPYFELGTLAASKAKMILVDKRSPSNIPIDTVSRFTHQVNLKAATKLGVTVPSNLKDYIETITVP